MALQSLCLRTFWAVVGASWALVFLFRLAKFVRFLCNFAIRFPVILLGWHNYKILRSRMYRLKTNLLVWKLGKVKHGARLFLSRVEFVTFSCCNSCRKRESVPPPLLRIPQRYQPGSDYLEYQWPLFSFRAWWKSQTVFSLGRWQQWQSLLGFTVSGWVSGEKVQLLSSVGFHF